MSATRFTKLRVGPSGSGAAADISLIRTGTVTWDPASVGAATAVEQNIAFASAAVGDIFILTPPAALNDGLIVGTGYCRTAGQITITIGNCTAGSLDAASGSWGYLQIRAA